MGTLSQKSVPKNYFKELKFILKLAGVSLESEKSRAYRIYSWMLHCFTYVYLYFYLTTVFKQGFSQVNETTFAYLIGFPMAAIKAMVVMRYGIQFGNMLSKIEQEPFTIKQDRGGEAEDKLIRECVWITKAQTYVYWVSGSFSVLGASAIGFFAQHIFAYGPVEVLNITSSNYFPILAIYQAVASYILMLQFTTVDLIIAAVLAHISYQFKILQNNLRRLLQISYEKMLKDNGPTKIQIVTDEVDGSLIPWHYLQQPLKAAIDYHQAITNLVEEIETLFSGLLFLMFFVTLNMLCVLIYHTSGVSLNDPQMMRQIGEILCAILQSITVCYWGQQVIDQSQEVGRAAYESNFVGTDLKFQKSIILIIRRSQKPTSITAKKFTVICLATFAWIMRTSYSFFMALKNMEK